jgi:hypothetical protein
MGHLGKGAPNKGHIVGGAGFVGLGVRAEAQCLVLLRSKPLLWLLWLPTFRRLRWKLWFVETVELGDE